ncbi:MAG: hypothetical protein H0U75_12835 [Legionella sp.]|nr:hypothetical protein [Legionella sp.]
MKLGVLIFGLFVTHFVFAQSILPTGCEPLEIKGESLILNPKKTDLIFIHNMTKMDIWITHPVRNPSASAGWSSRLQSDNWSALVVSKKSFELTCIESKPGHEQQIPCEGAIAACRWNHVRKSAKSKGTFWGAENKSLSALKAAVGARGFVLKQKS